MFLDYAKLRTIRKWLLILNFSIGSYILFRSTEWIPSPVGDGVMLPQAAMTGEGRLLFKDIYELYGPTVPLIQALFLKMFGFKLIVIRYLGAIIIIATALVLYLVLQTFINKSQSFIMATVIIYAQPAWNNFSNTRWPIENVVWFNNYGVFFSLISFYILLRIVQSNAQRIKLSVIVLFNVSLWLAVNTRFEFVFILVILHIYIYFFSNIKSSTKKIFLLTGTILYLLQIIFLVCTKSFFFYFNDIIRPIIFLEYFSATGAPPSYYFKCLLAAAASSILLLLIIYCIKLPQKMNRFQFMPLLVLFLAIPITTVKIENFKGIPSKIKSALLLTTSDFVLSFAFLVILLTTFISIAKFKEFFQKNLATQDKKITFLFLIFPLSFLPNLHNPVSDYFIMILPPFLISLIYFYNKSRRLDLFNLLNNFTIALVIASFCNFIIANKSVSYPYDYKILSGLRDTSKTNIEFIEAQFRAIDKYSDKNLSIECASGLYSYTKFGYQSESRFASYNLSNLSNLEKVSYNSNKTIYYACGLNLNSFTILLTKKDIEILSILPDTPETYAVIYKKVSN